MASRDISQILNKPLSCKICKKQVQVSKYRRYRCLADHQYFKRIENNRILADHQYCWNENNDFCRCKTTEELLKSKNMLFNCANFNQGCQEILNEKAMLSHEIKCIYRTVTCPKCEAKVSFHGLCDHLIENDFKNFTDNKLQWALREFDGKLFFVGIKDFSDKTFDHWVYMIGTPDEAKNYRYTMENLGRNPTINFNCSGELFSVNITPWKCFRIKFEILKAQNINNEQNGNYLCNNIHFGYFEETHEESAIEEESETFDEYESFEESESYDEFESSELSENSDNF